MGVVNIDYVLTPNLQYNAELHQVHALSATWSAIILQH